MNDHDSEKMAAMLEGLGLTRADSAEGAHVMVVNTCSIREKAEHKVYSSLGRLKSLKVRNPDLVAVVAGCVAQQEKERLLKRVPDLDAVIGTHCIADLPGLVEQIRQERDRVVRTGFSSRAESLHLAAPSKGSSSVCSYVTIMQGCSNFCSYCVVPYTRGPEQSRSEQEIIEEVQRLTAAGVKEVTLLGQNVNAYGNHKDAGCSFAELLAKLDRVTGLERIRFTTSHPRDFHEDLIEAMASLGKVCEHIHLPLQSGSDRILKAMRRGYTLDEYLAKVAALRDRIPGVALTTDIIVGFPGETDEDFQQTMEALASIRYDQIFSFKYSVRPGTLARKLPHRIADEVKAGRLAAVQALQERITDEYHLGAVGTEEEILVEGIRDRSGQPFGRTRTNKIVNVDAAEGLKVGDVVRVSITKGLKHSLLGYAI
jgi:tRNA-2-methylthio-N6-dimethylallyladenosine synthase